MPKDFWPVDTDKEVYIEGERILSLEELKQLCEEKWPGTEPSLITMRPEYIHTFCLGYDRYDPQDYTSFIVLTNTTK